MTTRDSRILVSPEEQREAGNKQPEHRGRVGQKRAAVAIRAEEREKRQQRDEARFESTGQSSSRSRNAMPAVSSV